eukprot:scaffold7169_cov107-Cylindrotheca_fusiformis.AAC.1
MTLSEAFVMTSFQSKNNNMMIVTQRKAIGKEEEDNVDPAIRAVVVAETVVVNEKEEDPEEEEEEEVFYVVVPKTSYGFQQTSSQQQQQQHAANYLDDLTPPAINWKRDSILFSENPSTRRNDAALKVWDSCQDKLPPIMTGAWPWRRRQRRGGIEKNPLGALYNMTFVRMPVIGIAVVYIQNLLHGHPLIMDMGHGPFEVSPFAVLSILALILA